MKKNQRKGDFTLYFERVLERASIFFLYKMISESTSFAFPNLGLSLKKRM